jgi:hypothetical protein
MQRKHLMKLLHEYASRYPEEAQCLERFRSFIRQNPQCFERTLTIGHITGSAWVVNKGGSRALLTHHKKLNQWLQVGGHADGNADVLAVALREAQEESGIATLRPLSKRIFDIDIHIGNYSGSFYRKNGRKMERMEAEKHLNDCGKKEGRERMVPTGLEPVFSA